MSDEKTIIADPNSMTFFKAPQAKRACLVQYNGTKLGRRYPINERMMTIGRAPDVQISIPETSVSRQHARIVQIENGVEIEDLNSSNGTFVNDTKAAARIKLKDGDMIRLGTILLKFFATDNFESM